MHIGNYRPEDKKPELEIPATAPTPPAPPTPGKLVADAFERGLGKDISETEDVAKKAVTYEDLLKEEGITKEEARRIQDALLIDGYYEEVVPLTPKTSVTFRSRAFADFTRYHQVLERYQPKYVAERDEITLRYFLAASLAAYAGDKFDFPDPSDIKASDVAFEERHQRVLRMPEHVVEMLGRRLNRFDTKLRVVLSEGSVESF